MKKKNHYRNYTKQIWEFCSTRWQKIVHISGITILAILFARFIVYDLMSLSVFAPMEKATDFQMSDIYQSISESKAIHKLSKDITIVSIDGHSRADVLDVVNLISEYSPAAIGLDVFFPVPEHDNSYLLSTLSSIPNLVCAGMFERDNDTTSFHHITQSFYEDSIDVTFGYANFNASSQRDVIRQFVPFVLTANNDTLLSMPAQLAKICHPLRYKTMLLRGGSAETIAFDNIEFPIISAQDVLSGDVDETFLSNRIVLIGDIHNIYDSYLSPLHNTLPGIVLHAYALQTIISDNYINTSSTWLNWLIALILCVLFTICNLTAKYHMSNFGNLFTRLLQFAMMYILIVIGSIYFASHHNYIDFSPAILMIGFGSLSFDLWFGCIAMYNHLKKLIKK